MMKRTDLLSSLSDTEQMHILSLRPLTWETMQLICFYEDLTDYRTGKKDLIQTAAEQVLSELKHGDYIGGLFADIRETVEGKRELLLEFMTCDYPSTAVILQESI